MRMLNEQDQNEIEVTWIDQQAINSFSRLNSTYSDIEHDLSLKKEQLESLEDLSMELELADEDEPVMYKVGDAFVSLQHEQAMERLDKDKEAVGEEVKELEGKLEQYEEEMKGLKVKLYAKFGDNINLERD
ncbi:probable GIM3-Gim complex component [Ustilago bromivora]|uniref:Prefoldin subunit 4 n=1 Tax=Ustilago bromivora TaxID=307758 RepID=A0A1K0HA58_9BASI|nr:probable GIM3-Gim complex component [Ustilago bromivora]